MFCLQRLDTKISWSFFSNFPSHWSQLCPNLDSILSIRYSLAKPQTFRLLNVNEEIYTWNSEQHQEQRLSFVLSGEFCKNGPALPWILISDYEKRARLKTPCLGDINASNFTPKNEFCEKVQNRWEIYNLKVAKFC